MEQKTQIQKLDEAVEIKNLIYIIRGKQVMLDSDLGLLYDVETKRVNEAVRRNKEKFPERFSWILNDTEINILWSQNATANIKSKSRSKPRVFTEQGVAMLATVLKSSIATKMSINIMDAFVEMRKYISTNLIEQKYINNMVLENHADIKMLQESFKRLEDNKKINSIFFEGQIYDAYSLLIDILSTAKKEIIIIDNFAGKELLDILKNIHIPITIVSNKTDEILKDKYNKQYKNVTFIDNRSFHDRFILIDKKTLYHCGASFKDLGKKCFAINKIEDTSIIENIIHMI